MSVEPDEAAREDAARLIITPEMQQTIAAVMSSGRSSPPLVTVASGAPTPAA